MTIEFVAPLQRGWDRMKGILFQPFDAAGWLVMGFTVWLARLVSGNGDGVGYLHDGDSDGSGPLFSNSSDGFSSLFEHAVWLPLILILAMVVVAFILVLMWLSSRGKFMFLDNVVHGQPRIVEPWTRYRAQGNSLFLWRVGFGLACLLVIGFILLVTIGPAAAGLSVHDALAGLSIAAMVIGGLLVCLLAMVMALVSLLLDSFVVPVMYKFGLTTTEAWRYVLPWVTRHPGYFLVYALLVLLLLVGYVVCVFVVCLFTCCIMVIPLLGSYVEAVLLLPLWVTYRAFTVEFLAQFDPGFNLFAASTAEAEESTEE